MRASSVKPSATSISFLFTITFIDVKFLWIKKMIEAAVSLSQENILCVHNGIVNKVCCLCHSLRKRTAQCTKRSYCRRKTAACSVSVFAVYFFGNELFDNHITVLISYKQVF